MNIVGGSSTSRVIRSDYTVKSRSVGDLVQDRVLPRQVGTGAMRGQQTIVGADGQKIVLGLIPDTNNEFGIAHYDTSGSLVTKHIGSTRYIYDDDGLNFLQDGVLSNGVRGFIIVKDGNEVDDVLA